MRAPRSWLAEFAPFDIDDAEMASTFDDLGLVVEGVDVVGADIADDVVVAKVMEIGPVPHADRVRRVTVDIGEESVDVVCGAWNFSEGDYVAVAKVGAELPGGLKIRRRKIKGVSSEGMLCSGAELGLSDDTSGIVVLGSARAGGGLVTGVALVDALDIRPEVVFDLAVEANRPDAMCIAGVARDLAARLKLPFRVPDHRLDDGRARALDTRKPNGPGVVQDAPVGSGRVSLLVEDPIDCPRFTATCVTGVQVTQSPAWLARRLLLAGMRPINSLVDASNYVMMELGQPTHPYDLDLLDGSGLMVRAARDSDVLVTLDGVERTFAPAALRRVEWRGSLYESGAPLICDAAGKPVGIAGIMGGASTQITAGTTNVLVEAAYFEPLAIARTSKRLGLRTEASVRFERGCDPGGIDGALSRLCQLIMETSATAVSSIPVSLEAVADPPRPSRMKLRLGRLNSVLGTELAAIDVESSLEPMGFSLSPSGDQGSSSTAQIWDVTAPGYRPDVTREIDLVEEVARQHGYSRIERTRPAVTNIGVLSARQRERRLVRQVLVGLGASEAWTRTLVSGRDHAAVGISGGVEIANPLNVDESILRRSLMPGLLGACHLNQARQAETVRLFEVGRIFEAPAGGAQASRAGGVAPELDRPAVAAGDELSGEAIVAPRALAGSLPIAPLEAEVLAAVFAGRDDGLLAAMEAWRTLSAALGLEDVDAGSDAGVRVVAGSPPGLHPARSAWLVVTDRGGPERPRDAAPAARSGPSVLAAPEGSRLAGLPGWGACMGPWGAAPVGTLGCVGEVSPAVSEVFGLDTSRGRTGWLEVDLARVFAVPRRSRAARPPSRFPSNDVDLAFAVKDDVPSAAIESLLARVGGELLESVRLFDVFRSAALGEGQRSLAYRLRFCAPDRTLSDSEVGTLRTRCIDAVERDFPAKLRGS